MAYPNRLSSNCVDVHPVAYSVDTDVIYIERLTMGIVLDCIGRSQECAQVEGAYPP